MRGCASVVCVAFASVALGQTMWTVDDDGGADFTDIQPAIGAAADGDTVLVYPGTYSGFETGGKAVEVRSSEGPEVTVVAGDRWGPALSVRRGEGRGTVIRGLGFTRGAEGPTTPVCRLDGSSPALVGCVFRGYEPVSGLSAPVEVRAGGPLFEGCRFESNAGHDAGALLAMASALELRGCAFVGNHTGDEEAGALKILGGVARVEGCRFEGNRGDGAGGAQFSSATVTVERCEFVGNGGGLEGGAIRTRHAGLTVVDCVLEANDANHGGGLMINDGTAGIARTRIVGNTAFRRGGGVTNGGELTLTGCEIVGNSAGWGEGAIEAGGGTLTLGETRVCDNGPDAVGGPWVSLGGNCVLEFCARCECAADWDMDGAVNTADFLAYLGEWAGGGWGADINADGEIDTRDFVAFLGAWSVGC